MTSKPRLSGSDVVKKYKMKLDEPKNSDFLNLFGTPITKTSKSLEVTKPKEPPKPIPKPESKGMLRYFSFEIECTILGLT